MRRALKITPFGGLRRVIDRTPACASPVFARWRPFCAISSNEPHVAEQEAEMLVWQDSAWWVWWVAVCALAVVATLLVDKWYPTGRFMGHPEAIFRAVVFGPLASVATFLVDNLYLKGIIFLVIWIVGLRISRELLSQTISRLIVIALGWGFAWLASKGVALVAPRADDVVFYGIGLLWTRYRWLGSDTRGSTSERKGSITRPLKQHEDEGCDAAASVSSIPNHRNHAVIRMADSAEAVIIFERR